jgi:hypothetical protein
MRGSEEARAAVGLVAGGPLAFRSSANAYRVRLVNEKAGSESFELCLSGALEGRVLQARGTAWVPGCSAIDVYVVTDWQNAFELTPTCPLLDRYRFLAARSSGKSCRLTVTLRSSGHLVDELEIVQPVAE